MLTTIKTNNKGKIKGRILEKAECKYSVEGENFYEGKLVVERLSEANDILPFTISEKLVKAYNLTLDAGMNVSFSGELRSYNKLIDNKSRLIISFFVKEVNALEDEDESDVNQLSLTGYIWWRNCFVNRALIVATIMALYKHIIFSSPFLLSIPFFSFYLA